MIMLNSSQVKA